MRRDRRRSREAVRLIPYSPAPVDGSLALRPAMHPAMRPARPALRAVSPEDARADPDLRSAAAVIVRLVAEVLTGVRARHHLARRAAPEVCRAVAVAGAPAGDRIAPVRILTCWTQEPAPGVAEGGAVVALAGQVHALAMRLERHRGRWRCTALETTVPAP